MCHYMESGCFIPQTKPWSASTGWCKCCCCMRERCSGASPEMLHSGQGWLLCFLPLKCECWNSVAFLSTAWCKIISAGSILQLFIQEGVYLSSKSGVVTWSCNELETRRSCAALEVLKIRNQVLGPELGMFPLKVRPSQKHSTRFPSCGLFSLKMIGIITSLPEFFSRASLSW